MNVSDNTVEIFFEKPKNFLSDVEIVICFIQNNQNFLFLQKAKDSKQSELWGIPSGKIENNETINKAMIRELFEETQILAKEEDLKYLTKLFIKAPNLSKIKTKTKNILFTQHIFNLKVKDKPKVILSKEHQNYIWITLKNALHLPLMVGGEKILKIYLEHFIE